MRTLSRKLWIIFQLCSVAQVQCLVDEGLGLTTMTSSDNSDAYSCNPGKQQSSPWPSLTILAH